MSKMEKAQATRAAAEQSLSTATPENQAALAAAVQSAINIEASTALAAQADADREKLEAAAEHANEQATTELAGGEDSAATYDAEERAAFAESDREAETPPPAPQEILTLSQAPARELGEEADTPEATEPELLGTSFHERPEGSGMYMRGESRSAAFHDQDDKIKIYDGEEDSCRAAMELAKQKGWTDVQWNGNKDALPKMWLEGQMVGVEVSNYKPTEMDLAALEKRLAEREAATLALTTEGKTAGEQLTREVSTPEATTEKETAKLIGERLVDHGAAPYQFKDNNAGSYFATLEGADGAKRTVWGVGIRDAIDDAGAKIGDQIELNKTGSKTVIVPENGVPTEKTRNSWSANVVGEGLETTQAVAASEAPALEAATVQATASEQPAVATSAGNTVAQEAATSEVAAALAAAQESARQEVARQEAANKEKARAEAVKQEKAAAEKAAKQEAAAQKAALAKAEREKVKAAREAKREAKLKGMGRTSVRYVTDAWGWNARKIVTTHRPTPLTDAARAAQRETAAAKAQVEQRRAERKKETAILEAKAKKSERIAGRMEGMHGRKGITVDRVISVEREMQSSKAPTIQEATPERVVAPPQPQREQPQQERPAVQQPAPQVAQLAQPQAQKGPTPEAINKIAEIDAEKMTMKAKMAEHQNQKAAIEAKKLSPREFAQSLVKSQPGQEADKSKSLNKGRDFGAGL